MAGRKQHTRAAARQAGRVPASDVDVVVIGAGVAGLAASRQLCRAELSHVTLEAGDRIGGRVHTDRSIFGVPYDIGAHWLHTRKKNPFADYGLKHGFDIYRAPTDGGSFHVGNRLATAPEEAAYERARKATQKAIARVARSGRDRAASEVLPDRGDWALTVDLYVGAYEMGRDLDAVSCIDWYESTGGADFYCREGFGALVAHWARGIPVELNTRADVVRWGGAGVEVETPRGTIRARAALITVSVGVLAAGGIRFDPALPEARQEALGQVDMSHYNHVALRFDRDVFGIPEDGYVTYKARQEPGGPPLGFGALVNAGGTGITYCDLGGSLARALSREGAGAAEGFVLDELKRIFGANVGKGLVGRHHFDWTAYPLTLGAYAGANPGGYGGREVLSRPEAGKLWFAGEAMGGKLSGTVAGARKSGTKAAKKLARALAGQGDLG